MEDTTPLENCRYPHREDGGCNYTHCIECDELITEVYGYTMIPYYHLVKYVAVPRVLIPARARLGSVAWIHKDCLKELTKVESCTQCVSCDL